MNLLKRKKKINPEQYEYVGEIKNQTVEIQSFFYTTTLLEENPDFQLKDFINFPKAQHTSWVNFHGVHEHEKILPLAKQLQLHHLSIQDIFDVKQRPKFQIFPDYILLNINSIFKEDDALELYSEQISFVLGKAWLASFQEKKNDHFTHLRERIRQDKGIVRERSADYLLYLLLEAILDEYSILIETLFDEINKFQSYNINSSLNHTVFQQIAILKKNNLVLKKSIVPIMEFCEEIEFTTHISIEDSSIKYFKDLKDYCNHLIEDTEEIKSGLESNINLFFSAQNNQMNQIIKILTIVSTIFIPLTFIAGIYGMNFEFMPELAWPYSYLVIWIVFIGVFVGMLVYFKNKKWF